MGNGRKNKKAYFKKALPATLVLCVILLFSGCSNDNAQPTPTTGLKNTEITSIATNITAPTNQPGFNIAETKEIYYYTVNSETLETEAVSSIVADSFEVGPEEILTLVQDTMEDSGYEIGIEKVTTEGTMVIISFQEGTEPTAGLSKDEEKAILDAIAQSLLDNSEDYNKVVFRIMDKEYVTENYSFGIDYVYMKD